MYNFWWQKNLAVNRLPLEALPAIQTWTELQMQLQDCGHVTSSGLLFDINHEKPDAKSLQ